MAIYGQTVGVKNMLNKIRTTAPFLVIILAISIFIQWMYSPTARESIIFFPIDKDAEYESANTQLILDPKKQNDTYTVQWKISSKLNNPAYLRQDIGFVFFNGRLKGKMNEWEQNTDQIVEEMTLEGKESSLLQAISYHYSEIHPSENEFTSAQKITDDRLYVIDSNFSPLNSFREPSSSQEEEWRQILDKVTNQQLQYWWEKALNTYNLSKEKYKIIPLTQLPSYENKPILGYSQNEWEHVLGNLWEGLYKNYFLGIKKENGTVVESIDSTIPLILFDNERKYLHVLTITKNGETVLLKQQINTQ